MTKRAPKLPPPTRQEREAAAIAVEALAVALADPTTRGERSSHACLPGWEYTRAEVELEMIPDLRALAEHGVRPCLVTDGRPLTPDLFGVMS